MKSFLQFWEAMTPAGYEVAFMGGGGASKKAPADTEMAYPILSFIEQYFQRKGLFFGKEPISPYPFPIECLDDVIENGEGPTVIMPPVEGVHTRVLAYKFVSDCIDYNELSDGTALVSINYECAVRLIKSYVRQVGGYKPGTKKLKLNWSAYYSDIEDGIDCILSNILQDLNVRRKESMRTVKGILTAFTDYIYDIDITQRERLKLPPSFAPYYEELKQPGMPTVILIFTAEKIPALLAKLTEIDSEMPEGDPLKHDIEDLKRMATTANTKKIGLYIRPFRG